MTMFFAASVSLLCLIAVLLTARMVKLLMDMRGK